jgi:hypothetical protein
MGGEDVLGFPFLDGSPFTRSFNKSNSSNCLQIEASNPHLQAQMQKK